MTVGWLLLSEAALPPDDAWLGAAERDVLAALRFERRRRDWRLGRFAAHQAIRRCPWLEGVDLRGVAIESDPDGVPRARLGGDEPCALSLSHRAGWGLCALAPPEVRVGCDLERIEPRSDAFLADYFTPAERRLVAGAGEAARDVLANAIWCAKESAVKLLGTGWRVPTRSVGVESLVASGPGWRPLRVRADALPDAIAGWWREGGDTVISVVARPSADPPTWLARPTAARA